MAPPISGGGGNCTSLSLRRQVGSRPVQVGGGSLGKQLRAQALATCFLEDFGQITQISVPQVPECDDNSVCFIAWL